ncbi:spermidine/putrescine ABC transporter substrate-binding protein [Paraburkholderia sp. J8-2]|uniref:ABC transporter substrate-binding protein n=1 Tax=Paraburkholderia sp. J8-2 TaxID=2805440 RepID=UPI002AB77AAE|nr:spermidine/putrescine ABC transporter substrate-binding protein [Paraburkholderia sp. J8-2]
MVSSEIAISDSPVGKDGSIGHFFVKLRTTFLERNDMSGAAKFAAALSAVALVSSAQAAGNNELHVYAWDGEIPQQVVSDFEKEAKAKVIIDTFDSNETVIAKLQAGAGGYDLIEPSNYAIQILVKNHLVQPLDRTKLPNIGNIGGDFIMAEYNDGSQYGVPYVWGTTGVAYNTDCVKSPVTSWKALWDKRYQGRSYMLNNMRGAYAVALQLNGFHVNSTNPAEVAKATTSLIAQKPILGGYNSTNYADLLSSGEACIAQAYSNDVERVVEENPKVKFILPDEGGTRWVDDFAIPVGAPNKTLAYQFLNFVLRPDVAARITELTKTASTVEKSQALLPASIASNSAIFPPASKVRNTDFVHDVGEATNLYRDGWTKVQAAQ